MIVVVLGSTKGMGQLVSTLLTTMPFPVTPPDTIRKTTDFPCRRYILPWRMVREDGQG